MARAQVKTCSSICVPPIPRSYGPGTCVPPVDWSGLGLVRVGSMASPWHPSQGPVAAQCATAPLQVRWYHSCSFGSVTSCRRPSVDPCLLRELFGDTPPNIDQAGVGSSRGQPFLLKVSASRSFSKLLTSQFCVTGTGVLICKRTFITPHDSTRHD